MENKEWLRTDDIQELKTCLRTISRELLMVSEDINVWKIIIILQHNALQAAMVRTLRQGNIMNILTPKSRKEYEEYMACTCGAVHHRDFKLLQFKELYRRVKSPKYMEGKPFRSNKNSDVQVERLNSFRNDFIHFVSSGWSVQASMFPDIVRESNRIIMELLETPRNLVLIPGTDRDEIISLISRINEINEGVCHDYVG